MKKYSRTSFNVFILLSAIMAIALDIVGSAWFYAFKPFTTMLIILLVVCANALKTSFGRTLVTALCFCLLGDILLMNPRLFVYGLSAFLMGHILFIYAFIKTAGYSMAPQVVVVLLAVGVGLYSWLFSDLGTLRIPVAIYVMVILLMAIQGISAYLKKRRRAYGYIAMGAMLFMLSDSLIAVDKFKIELTLAGLLILSTYWLAIGLIANAGVLILERDSKA